MHSHSMGLILFQVELTVRQLVSHLGGIRHYKTKPGDVEPANKNSDTESLEFFLYRKFKTVEEALELFKDDPLLSKPGKKIAVCYPAFNLIRFSVAALQHHLVGKHIGCSHHFLQNRFTSLHLMVPLLFCPDYGSLCPVSTMVTIRNTRSFCSMAYYICQLWVPSSVHVIKN